MSFSITESVDRYVAAQSEEREPDGKHHPSSLFGCERAGVYTFIGTPKSNPPEARSLRIFRLGTLFHEDIQKAIHADPDVELFYDEVKVYDPDLNITGHADGLVRLKNGRWVVIELKSIGSWGFKKKDLPQDDHKGQALTYAKTLRDYGGLAWDGSSSDADGKPVYTVEIPPLGDAVSSVRFCYVNKESGETKEFDVQLTPTKEQAIYDRVAAIDAHVEAGTLPDRLPLEDKKGKLVKNFMCESYCDYRDLCWETPAAEPEFAPEFTWEDQTS